MRSATSEEVINCLKRDVFHLFGVPEVIHSDNGKQFVCHKFKDFLDKYGIRQMPNAFYSPQANASERVNRSLLAAIRSYIGDNHKNWDLYLDEIAGALRSSVHGSIGFSPSYALFGRHPISHASQYSLIQDLKELNDVDIDLIGLPDKLAVIRKTIQDNLKAAHERQKRTYDLRSREKTFVPGQMVRRRNFVQSDKEKNFNAKFARKFIPAIIAGKVGQQVYTLKSLDGTSIGKFHAKDLQEF